MYQARDPRTGRIVQASDASPRGYYVCPVCKADVFLRHGDHRVAHFAHRPGLALPECELYHSSADDIQNPWPIIPTSPRDGAAPENERIPPLALSITIEPEAAIRRNRLRGWSLVLTVPKSADDHGQIMIDCGGDFRPKISLTKLAFAPQTYPAYPDSVDYGAVWVSPEVRPEYRSAVMHRIPGLKRGQVTAFATGAQKYKPRVESLLWATNYYFVWRRDGQLSLPAELLSQSLADSAAWCCALISLPDEGDAALVNWLRERCGLRVVHEKRKWSIIYPAAYNVDIGGRVQLPPTSSILMGTFVSGEATGHDSLLECTAGDLRASVVVPPARWHFFEVAADDAVRESVLALNWDHIPLPELTRVAPSHAGPPFAVVLDFRSKRNRVLSQAALHHMSCREALKSVRATALDITGIQVPAAISGEFRWRAADQIQWQSLALNGVASRDARGVSLPPDVVSSVNNWLQDQALEASLSFGPFGEFCTEIEPAAPTTRPRLRSTTRAKVIWYCKSSKAYASRTRKPVDALDDGELLAHFVSVPAPAWLVVHKRAIERELERDHSGRAGDE